jgi:HAD superfamily hydrolase (TIGR01509 family)
MAYDAVLFDLDGTLWDSAPWYAALLEADAEAQERLTIALRSGEPGHSAAKLLRRAGYTNSSFTQRCKTRGESLRLFEGAAETLVSLQAAGVRLGAVTNLPRWVAEPMLRESRVTPLCQVLATWRPGKGKPKPDLLLEAVTELATPASRAVYIGDSPTDALAADAAGMRFLWASWGYGETSPPGCDVLGSWTELLA